MKKIIFLILIVFSISSCEDFLDEQPISDLSADNFWKLERDIVAGLAGMYDGMQDIVDESFIDWGEARSDNFDNGGFEDASAFTLNGLTSDMDDADWSDLYATINRANLIIKYVPQISGDLTDRERNNYVAQGYAMRAYCHLLGVKVWGDIPLLLKATTDRDVKPFRTSANQVLDAVVADLIKARELVDENNINVFEINVGGILAILADAYMWQHEYQKVIQVTDELIALNRYKLAIGADEWKRNFTDPSNSRETIWSLYRNVEEDDGNGIAERIGSSDKTSPLIMDSNLLAKWQQQRNTDFRAALTYDTTQAISTGAVQFIWKHFAPAENGDPSEALTKRAEANIQNPMYRLAGILLLRAEAYNQLDNEPGAVAILSDIKVRAGLDPVTVDDFNSKDELENAILDERQLELFAEGKRWFDLRRTGKVIEVMEPLLIERQMREGVSVIGFADPGLELFPIHSDALNENTNLEQNPPYSR